MTPVEWGAVTPPGREGARDRYASPLVHDAEEDDRSAARCTSCGATVERPPHHVSSACTYCGSQLVDVARGEQRIDRVAPFRLAKAAAQDRLRQHLASRFWAPRALRQRAAKGRLEDERLAGVLVPFQHYEAECHSRFAGDVGVHWYEKKTKRNRKTGKTETVTVQHTEWFPFRGTAAHEVSHLESASTGLPADEASKLGGFDLGRAVRFDARLLSGWLAELPSKAQSHVDADAEAAIVERERRRILSRHLPGNTHRGMRVDTEVDVQRVELVLLPVWITAYRYRGKVHRLLVHGQSGRCIGSAPVSRAKVAIAAAIVAAIGLFILWATGVLG